MLGLYRRDVFFLYKMIHVAVSKIDFVFPASLGNPAPMRMRRDCPCIGVEAEPQSHHIIRY